MRAVFLPLLSLLACSVACAEVDYVTQVKPLLANRCYACHGALKQEASFRLDTVAATLKGGDSGPALVADKSGESLLIERVTHADVDLRMPPEGEGASLNPDELALLKSWIDQGAKGPADELPEPDPREHWAFRAPVRPQVPAAGDSSNPIDAFLAAEWKKHGLVPRQPAEKRILLRRVYLDLIGLPPTAAELAAFVADDSPDAYLKVVDRLLDSPQYGERWGRHWMDIWRYSDWWGLGAEVRNSQKHIWHWRDWIVESLNDDVGYDEMLRQMLAADELYPNDLNKLRATGYLARQYFKFNRNSWMEETIEHTSKAFLGMTFNCARCHDHKYDPISQRDYYRFRAFFEPYQVRMEQAPGEIDFEKDGIPRAFDCNLEVPTYHFIRGDDKRPVTDEPLSPGLPGVLSWEALPIEPVDLPLESYRPELRPWVITNYKAHADRQIADAEAALKSLVDNPASNEKPEVRQARIKRAEALVQWAKLLRSWVDVRATADQARCQQPPAENHVELARAAALGELQVLHALATRDVASAELDLLLATDDKKPELEKKLVVARENLAKAAKAMESPGDTYKPLLGASKTPESNVETAESLKRSFPATSTGRRSALARWMIDPRHPTVARVAVNHIWMRHMGAPLVPTVFDFGRKGSKPTHPELLDWLAVELIEHKWSMKHVHRLIVTSSAYRMASSARGGEANLKVDSENRYYWRMNAGRLESQVVRDSLLHLAGELDLARGGPSIPIAQAEASKRRSLYFVHSHNEHAKFLTTFDDANVLDCYRRERSIVPQQALAISNSKLALEASTKIAASIQAEDDSAFIRTAFVRLLSDEPTDDELQACLAAIAVWRETKLSIERARANLVHVLLNHNDFITVR